MNEEKKQFLIILAIVILIVVGFVVSGIFLKQEPKKVDKSRAPVNRIEKIREGFSD